MDDKMRRPVGMPVYSLAQSAPHQILVCKACKHKGSSCEPGFALLKKLRAAIAAAGLSDDFEVSGTACLAGCVRLCCTNPVRDSYRESSVVAGLHEQTDTSDLQDHELAGL